MENITQKELAEKLGIACSLLSEILSGKRRPSRALALQLESVSGVERMVWLYGDSSAIRSKLEKFVGRTINFSRGRPRSKG